MNDMPDPDFDRNKYRDDKAEVEGGFADKLRQTAGRIPFAEDAIAAYYCALDRETPLQVKGILMAALAYFVIPADVIPDFIAMMGYTDDAAVLAAAIRSVLPHITPRHRERAREVLGRDSLDGPL